MESQKEVSSLVSVIIKASYLFDFNDCFSGKNKVETVLT